MSRYKKVFISMVILIFVTGATINALRGQSQNHAMPNNKKEDATPIQEGVMTEKQRHHSKIFKSYGHVTKGKKLRDLVSEQGDTEIVYNIGELPVNPPLAREQLLQILTCEVDVVVSGVVKEKASQLLDEGTFIFTDYQLVVEDVLKNAAGNSLGRGDEITIVRPGGTVNLKGHLVRAVDNRQEPLKVGEKYLVYLELIPETGAYRPLSHPYLDDSFHLQDNKAEQVSQKPAPLGRRKKIDLDVFLAETNKVLHLPCHK
ncbi:MAG TPA: hypothetical protein VGX24_08085 [Pyrinomonadaceae bacterium]|jgi:hypothetical protein|nr:hypothetical protein [Pyrinomonadaceae bacterium]